MRAVTRTIRKATAPVPTDPNALIGTRARPDERSRIEDPHWRDTLAKHSGDAIRTHADAMRIMIARLDAARDAWLDEHRDDIGFPGSNEGIRARGHVERARHFADGLSLSGVLVAQPTALPDDVQVLIWRSIVEHGVEEPSSWPDARLIVDAWAAHVAAMRFEERLAPLVNDVGREVALIVDSISRELNVSLDRARLLADGSPEYRAARERYLAELRQAAAEQREAERAERAANNRWRVRNALEQSIASATMEIAAAQQRRTTAEVLGVPAGELAAIDADIAQLKSALAERRAELDSLKAA